MEQYEKIIIRHLGYPLTGKVLDVFQYALFAIGSVIPNSQDQLADILEKFEIEDRTNLELDIDSRFDFFYFYQIGDLIKSLLLILRYGKNSNQKYPLILWKDSLSIARQYAPLDNLFQETGIIDYFVRRCLETVANLEDSDGKFPVFQSFIRGYWHPDSQKKFRPELAIEVAAKNPQVEEILKESFQCVNPLAYTAENYNKLFGENRWELLGAALDADPPKIFFKA